MKASLAAVRPHRGGNYKGQSSTKAKVKEIPAEMSHSVHGHKTATKLTKAHITTSWDRAEGSKEVQRRIRENFYGDIQSTVATEQAVKEKKQKSYTKTIESKQQVEAARVHRNHLLMQQIHQHHKESKPNSAHPVNRPNKPVNCPPKPTAAALAATKTSIKGSVATAAIVADVVTTSKKPAAAKAVKAGEAKAATKAPAATTNPKEINKPVSTDKKAESNAKKVEKAATPAAKSDAKASTPAKPEAAKAAAPAKPDAKTPVPATKQLAKTEAKAVPKKATDVDAKPAAKSPPKKA